MNEELNSGSLVNRGWKVAFQPKEFFEKEDLKAPFSDSLVYMLIVFIVSAFLSAVFYKWLGVFSYGFIKYVVSLFVVFYVVSAVSFLILKNSGGEGTFAETVRVYAISSVMMLLLFIPFINYLAILYALFLQAVGLKRAHRIGNELIWMSVILAFLAGIIALRAMGVFICPAA